MSGFWSKFATAIKGGASEAGEAILDGQSVRIYEQEIRDSKGELQKAEHSLTKIMAKHKLSSNKVNEIQASIDEHTGYIQKALEQDNETLAMSVAEKLSELESNIGIEIEIRDEFKNSTETLKKNIKQSKNNLRRMETQIDQVKARESVQKARELTSSRHSSSNSKMKTAAESLNRIKEKQKLKTAELDAAEELAESESGGDLKAQLKEAGISGDNNSAASIMARFKNKSASPES
jgi:phage shock protein A